MRVLVVEDTPELAMLVKLSLEQCEWEVDLARDGRTGLDTVSTHHDVLLVDLGLPDMDGQVFVESLRRAENSPRLPVIWFTANTEVGSPLGEIGVIHKPFDPLTLGQQISDLLAAHGIPQH